MSRIAFDLETYPGRPAPSGVRIAGEARREGPLLLLDWRLEAPSGTVEIPPFDPHPQRRRELWQATCFEAFLSAGDRPSYWEFNLSPAGHWNVFRFEGYRKGMTDEAAFEDLPYRSLASPEGCEVSARIDTRGLGIADEPWRLAIATVVAERDGRTSFWALTHPGPEPDFHHPDAFEIALGQSR